MAGEGPASGAPETAEELLGLLRRWRASGGGELLLGASWEAVRAEAVAPVLAAASGACLAFSALLLAEAVFMAAASLARRRPERRYRADPLGAHDEGEEEDEESGLLGYPMVLVQIPMYNEREVYKLSIGAACALSWPSDRVIVQVLDDSTDPTVKDLVELECKLWTKKGKNMKYEVRNNRKGYKAGALKEGLLHAYVQQCDFLAVFDADFQPEQDFLMRTIPYLARNPQIALVQARWEFEYLEQLSEHHHQMSMLCKTCNENLQTGGKRIT